MWPFDINFVTFLLISTKLAKITGECVEKKNQLDATEGFIALIIH